MIDEPLTDDERAVMSAFDSVRPHPRIWRNALERTRGRRQRPLTGARYAGVLALAACAGIAAAIFNGHPLRHRVSTPAAAATRPGASLTPTTATPAAPATSPCSSTPPAPPSSPGPPRRTTDQR